MSLDNLAAAGAATTCHAAIGHRHIVLAQGIEQVHACGNAQRTLEGADKNFHLVRSVFSGGKAAPLLAFGEQLRLTAAIGAIIWRPPKSVNTMALMFYITEINSYCGA
jgi:type IV secretory pathway TrbD component